MQPFEIRKKDETINQRIARYRKAVGYSQKEMADFLGEKHSTYAQKERCGTIDCDTLIKISYILGMDINIMVIVSRNSAIQHYFDTKSMIWKQIFDENLTIPISMNIAHN